MKEDKKCDWFKPSPNCPKCGHKTFIKNRDVRACENCDHTEPLSKEDKEYFDKFIKQNIV